MICSVMMALFHGAQGHAVMYSPQPRSNVVPGVSSGFKLQPFASAQTIANAGCGGVENRDPGVEIPKTVYRPGETISVQWKLTIPHPLDVLNTGIRISLYYSPDDSFAQNNLAGGLAGDPPYTPVSAGPAQVLPVDGIPLQSAQVTLPMKTCDYCVLQWAWAAQADGGSYIGCADIAIKSDGQLPSYASLPSQAGRELPDGSGVGVASAADGGAGIAAGVLVALLLGGGVVLYYRRRRAKPPASGNGGGASATVSMGHPPPPLEPPELPLPPGWTQALDPASNATYYCNASTGETTWTRPTAARV